MTGERRSGTHSGVGRPHDGARVEENAILPENMSVCFGASRSAVAQ
jgi:hypothetical protein